MLAELVLLVYYILTHSFITLCIYFVNGPSFGRSCVYHPYDFGVEGQVWYHGWEVPGCVF